MNQMPSHQPGACPPHQWVISHHATEQGLVERSSCSRCGALIGRIVSRPGPNVEDTRRHLASERDVWGEVFAPGRERVA